MFTPSRADVRSFFIHTWQKYQGQVPLSGLEKMALDTILKHDEYHYALDQSYLQKDYFPEQGTTNPFLHMSLHLTIAEQLSIGQPYPIRALYAKFCQKTQDAHEAEHLMMDSLIDMLWQANQQHTPPNVSLYLGGLAKQLGENTDVFLAHFDRP